MLSTERSPGRDLSCAVRGPNSMLGLEGVVGRELPYAVRALTDVAFCSIDIASFKSWLGPLDSPVGVTLRISLDESIRRTGERLALEGTAVRRLARFLVAACDGGLGGERSSIPLGVLARTLDMRAETLSRALAELRERGALAPARGICVSDPVKLRQLAE